jgi:hypothetical protein
MSRDGQLPVAPRQGKTAQRGSRLASVTDRTSPDLNYARLRSGATEQMPHPATVVAAVAGRG